MNNELGRKITSLTLMTIMVAGGLTFAIPGVMPEAMAANANLYVSAENSQFDNYMSGPQVVEVVVIDSDINETNESKGEPDVTINGAKLRMAQATDGNWYGYFAEYDQAKIADATAAEVAAPGYGLDFGQFCGSASTALSKSGSTQLFSDTEGVAIPVLSSGTNFGVNGTDFTNSNVCSTTFTGKTGTLKTTSIIHANATYAANSSTANQDVEGRVANVVREAKEINTNTTANPDSGAGQIGLLSKALWPYIQLYDLSAGGDVVVQYNKGGGVQKVTLTFDTVDDYVTTTLDRTKYPVGAEVHVEIADIWLNIDPTDEDVWTFDTNNTTAGYGVFYGIYDEDGNAQATGANRIDLLAAKQNNAGNTAEYMTALMNADGILKINTRATGSVAAIAFDTNGNGASLTAASATDSADITFVETGPTTGIFASYDELDDSMIGISSSALRGTSGTIDYNDDAQSIVVALNFATIDIQPTDDTWNSGEEIPVVLVDGDLNKNSKSDEDIAVSSNAFTIIPAIVTGDPFTLGEGSNATKATYVKTMAYGQDGTFSATAVATSAMSVDSFSSVGRIPAIAADKEVHGLVVDFQTTFNEFRNTVLDTTSTSSLKGFNLLNIDLRALNSTGTFAVRLANGSGDLVKGTTGAYSIKTNVGTSHDPMISAAEPQSLTVLNGTAYERFIDAIAAETTDNVGIIFEYSSSVDTVHPAEGVIPFAVDFFSFGFTNDGYDSADRVANQIIRLELEETGDNTGEFIGTIEYVMINQLNILDSATYSGLSTISDEVSLVAIEDLTDEDSIRVNYLDVGADGVATQIADQEAAPTHSGVVSLDSETYKVADTVTVTLEDQDLNTDSSLIDIYTVVSTSGMSTYDMVGSATNSRTTLSDNTVLTRLLDITFDDEQWLRHNQGSVTCSAPASGVDNGLFDADFTLVETDVESGMFTGDFQIPSTYCKRSGYTGANGVQASTTGVDIEVNYVDFRDASGETIEVGDGAGVRANTGSVTLDRTVYPVPFASTTSEFTTASNASSQPNGRAIFPIHQSGVAATTELASGEFLANGDLTIHVRVNDPDFDISASGEDKIASNTSASVGPVKISVIRGSSSVVLGHAGGPTVVAGVIDTDATHTSPATRQFGPMTEIAPDAGIFEIDVTIRYTDGPASTQCPSTVDEWTAINGDTTSNENDRFDTAATSGDYCILQGDILQVEYTDPTDASGDVNTVTDSATFDLRNGVLQTDKSVYIIGSDIILTLIEPDFDLDNDAAETYDLDLIEWDSDAFTDTIGNKGGYAASFDPEPSDFRETGDSTGIFQVVLEMPASLAGDNLERGEEIVLEYTDWGPSGADYVGQDDEDVNVTLYTSNFGATVELDQKVYTWTDKVYITIVAPDHNFDSNLVDEIGETTTDAIKVSTRGYERDNYKLVETGTDTGIFTGEVILTGFNFDADGDSSTGNASGYDVTTGSATGSGPTDGKLPTSDDDGLTVSFEFSEDETVVGSALIRWNIGEAQWLEASYPASGTGVVRIIDPDMNWDPEAVNNFNVDVWSDSDAGGIDLTVTETNEATGIFEGTVFFTVSNESSGHRLRVAEGDTVTAEYEDNTLPSPYTTADELSITATTLIGTVVPPLERAPAANLRTVDAFGNSLDTVSVDQQVQISADLANGQDREQAFAYLVQIQDENGVTVSLAWITGSLSAGQSFSPALSWIPSEAGTYTATAFVWESVDNPTALSPPVSTTVNVR
ncbi:MAG: hypothetical protein ACW9WZ_00030 [Nitrosopumilus sp.]